VELADFHSPQEFITALKQAKITGKRSSPFVHFHSTWQRLKRHSEILDIDHFLPAFSNFIQICLCHRGHSEKLV